MYGHVIARKDVDGLISLLPYLDQHDRKGALSEFGRMIGEFGLARAKLLIDENSAQFTASERERILVGVVKSAVRSPR